jgi:hypothetical protein
MIIRKYSFATLALGVTAALFLSACGDSTGPAPVSEANKADLKVIAAKVKYFSAPAPSEDMGDGGMEKKAAGKRSASAACDQEAQVIFTGTDISAYGVVGAFWDTTTYYTAAGAPVCAETDEISYEITKSRQTDAVLESYITTRSERPADFRTGTFKMSGTGKVHYFSGYDLTVDAINMSINMASGVSQFTMTLGLQGGYTVVMALAPGIDLMSETEPAPTTVIMSGPIKSGGTTIGYFEILANDGVVIRDADKAVVEAH